MSPTGEPMDVPRIVRAVLESPSFEMASTDQRVQWIVNALAPALAKLGPAPAQRQDSLDDQMRDVMKLAVQAGCYDAHDWLLRHYAGRRMSPLVGLEHSEEGR